MSNYQDPSYTNGYEFTGGQGYELPTYPFVTPPELCGEAGKRHPVVIVGGGISGLTLAASLAQLGVPAVLLDEDNTVGVKGASSRGICYTQKSLEIFDKLGIFDRIRAKGIEWHIGRTFAGDDEVYHFNLRNRADFKLSSQPAFVNIQQFYIEGYLVERIAQLGVVDMRWQSRVSACTQDQRGVTLSVDTPEGSYQLQASYVVDCTGTSTPFHEWCGMPVSSIKRDDRWCIADVRFKETPPTERHTWIEAPFNDNRAVWQHLMADDVWRIDYQMRPDDDPSYVAREDVLRERLAKQFGNNAQYDIVWVGPYSYRSQLVERMNAGGIFFMGDTAKVVSPFGARGGNTGISDADNLAWKLAAVLHKRAPKALLNSYHQERHEAATVNVKVTARTTRYLRPQDGVERLFRDATIALAKQHSFARALVNTGRMAEANPYTRSSVCTYNHRLVGKSVQNVALQWTNGTAGCLNDLLRWTNGHLLLLWFTNLPKATAARLQQAAAASGVHVVQVVTNASHAQAQEVVIDRKAILHKACGQQPWALVRPDSYLAATGTSANAQLLTAIATALAMA
ncbi:FAD-dependent monooxygenase [Comamonadaceae bacterium M7527]|nr:FAD-dependent monooxygenase [Comamonadaceae bacterium M7527]